MVDVWGFTDWTQYFKRRTRNSNKNPHQNHHWQIKLVENKRRSLSISYTNLNVREDNTSWCNLKSFFCKIPQQLWKKCHTSDGSEWLKLFFLLCRMAVAQTGTNLIFVCLFVSRARMQRAAKYCWRNRALVLFSHFVFSRTSHMWY